MKRCYKVEARTHSLNFFWEYLGDEVLVTLGFPGHSDSCTIFLSENRGKRKKVISGLLS